MAPSGCALLFARRPYRIAVSLFQAQNFLDPRAQISAFTKLKLAHCAHRARAGSSAGLLLDRHDLMD